MMISFPPQLLRSIRRVATSLAVMAVCATTLEAQTFATLTFPVDGATAVDTRQPFTWNAVSGSLAYYLYVGSTTGAKDLYNSGEIQSTSLLVPNLPIGPTIWLRLWTKTSSGWVAAPDVSFVAASSYVPPATFIYPTNNASAADTANQPFRWTTAANALAYQLTVGTTSGANDLFDSGETQSTSLYVPALPVGTPLFARLGTKDASASWTYLSITFTASTTYAPRAQITFPLNNATNVDTRQPITWSAVSGALAYYLYVGSSVGAKDLYNSGEIQSTSLLVPGLPVGSPIWLRIWTKTSSGWLTAPDVTFVAGTSYSPPATFIYPANGGSADTANQQFRWTAPPNALAYQLTVGTAPAGNDLFDSGETSATSTFVAGLPVGTQLFARLGTKTAGPLWTYADITFTPSTSYTPRAQVLSPTNGATNVDTHQPVTWNAVSGALAYYLYVGSSVGANDLYNSGEIQSTSLLVPGLPVGPTIWLRLWTKTTSGWVAAPDSSFIASTSYTPPATFLYPANGASAVDTASQQFRWTTVSGSLAYQLTIGSTSAATGLFDSGETQSTSMFVPALPTGVALFARLGTKDATSVWTYVNITFTASTTYAPRAVITFPANGATNVDTRQPVTWSAVSGALAYYLYVGSSIGAMDLYNSGELQSTTALVPNLPAGPTIWLRIWTKTTSGWLAAPDVSFVAGTTYIPPATFLYPTNGMTNADTANQQFRWTVAAGALAYQLTVGTTSGASDLFDSGETQLTSTYVASLPTGTLLYARLGTKAPGAVWTYTNITFTATTTYVARAQFLYPPPGSTAADLSQPVKWTPVAGASAYYLYLGTTPRSPDLDNSGEVDTTWRFAPVVPLGSTIYATIWTRIGGIWYPADIQFRVSFNAVFANRLAAAFTSTADVRAMAGVDNVPLAGTLLKKYADAAGHTAALCNDYAATLTDLQRQRSTGSSRQLNICFNANRSESLDCHTLTEFYQEDTDRWIVMDPTFGLAAKVASSGDWATAADISAATAAGSWSGISYVALTPQGTAWANNYYLDYPLLYSNLYYGNSDIPPAVGNSVLPFLSPVSLPISTYGVYVLSSDVGNGAGAVIDGVQRTVPCDGIDSTSVAFYATTVDATGNSGRVTAYAVRRPVFEHPTIPRVLGAESTAWVSPGTLASFKRWQDEGKSHLWRKNGKD